MWNLEHGRFDEFVILTILNDIETYVYNIFNIAVLSVGTL